MYVCALVWGWLGEGVRACVGMRVCVRTCARVYLECVFRLSHPSSRLSHPTETGAGFEPHC